MNAKQLICLVGLFATVPAVYAQTGLPDSIKVPDGHKVAMETTGVGEITSNAGTRPMRPARPSGPLSAPKAVLNDRSGKQVGS